MEPCWMITEDVEGRLYLMREVRNEEGLLVFLTRCNLNQNLSSPHQHKNLGHFSILPNLPYLLSSVLKHRKQSQLFSAIS